MAGTTTDLTTLCRHGQIEYLVQSKTSGQVLGYACMLPNAPKVTEAKIELQLEPLHEGDPVHQPHKLKYKDNLTLVYYKDSLIADLNLSCGYESVNEISSIQLEDEPVPTCQADFNARVSLSQVPTSTPEQMIIQTTKMSPLVSQLVSSQSSAGFLPRTKVQVSSQSITTSLNQLPQSAPSQYSRAAPGPANMYKVFFQEVTLAGVDKKHKMGRCTLCLSRGVDKILHYSNMGRHIKGIHLPPEQCGGCGNQYSAVQIIVHRRTCLGEAEQNNNLEGKSLVGQNQVVPSTSHSSSISRNAVDTHSSCSPDNFAERSMCASPLKGMNDYISHHQTESRPLLSPQNKNKDSFPSGEYISLYMTSSTVQGVRIKIKVEKEAKLKKAMKKFGKKSSSDYKSLKFLIGERVLFGEDQVNRLKGNEIEVMENCSPKFNYLLKCCCLEGCELMIIY